MAGQSWTEDQLRKYSFPVEPILRLSFTDSKVDELISNGQPVVITDTDLVGSAHKWDLDYLREHIGDGNFSVYNSPNHLFKYYDEKKAEKKLQGSGSFQPPTKRLEMKFSEFYDLMKKPLENDKRIYLQQGLNDTVGPQIVRDFLQFNWKWVTSQQVRNNWGPLTSNLLLISQEGSVPGSSLLGRLFLNMYTTVTGADWYAVALFVCLGDLQVPHFHTSARAHRALSCIGPSLWNSLWNVTPCHYDEQENFFGQVLGYKRVILFPPNQFECLYPYPVFHPHDRQCQVDFENPDYKRFPKFRDAKGQDAVLGPGDVLYLPSYWFHNFETLLHSGPATSITFWYKAAAVGQIVRPLKPHQKMAIMRNIEKMVLEALGSEDEVVPFMETMVLGRYSEDLRVAKT